MIEMSNYFLLPLLFTTGLVAGTVDAIAGGGGLISVPVLLGVGLPPHIALGTNKLQSTIGTLVATHSYYRHRLFSLKTLLKGVVSVVAGAALGAYSIQVMSNGILNQIIPILLFIILAYSLFSPKLGAEDRKARLSDSVFYLIFGFALGFYDGFFGPGVGSFWVFLLTFYREHIAAKCQYYIRTLSMAPLLPLSLTQDEYQSLTSMEQALYHKGVDAIQEGKVNV